MKTGPEVARILQRYQEQPPLPGTADFPGVLVAAHVAATLNEESALALLRVSTSSPIQPICCFTISHWSSTPNWWFQLLVCNDPHVLFLSSLWDD